VTRAEAAKLARAARAKKAPSLHDRFWSKVDVLGADDCWPWRASVRNKKEGYGAFWFDGRHHPAPRISLYLTTGVMPNKEMQTCHYCDNPSCCNPSHLFIGSNKENTQDKVEKGRHCFGEKNGFSKLTEGDVLKIRSLRPYHALDKLGKMFGVHLGTIHGICERKSWNHI